MSIEALRWALEEGQARDLEPTQRHILLVLGNRADERGYLYPSVNWICARTGYARRTVQAHMKALEEAGILRRDQRDGDDGGRTSDAIWLGLKQPGLPLPDPRAEFALGGARLDTPPAQEVRPPRAVAAPNTQDKKQEKKKDAGEAAASPVSRAFRLYAENVKKKYGADYPPSASANGRLKNVIQRVGAEPALQVIQAYFTSPNTFYTKVRHSLPVLQKDCEQIWLELQSRGAGKSDVLPKIIARLVSATDTVCKDLGEQAPDSPHAIAQKVYSEYGILIRRLDARYIDVVLGPNRNRYSVEELAGTKVRPNA